MNRIMHPVEQEELMAWLDGELSAERGAAVAAHVKACEECLALAEEFRRVSAQMAEWEVESSPVSFADRVNAALQGSTENRKAKAPFALPERRRWIPTWAWQLGAVAVLLVVIAAISIPNLLRSRMARSDANERATGLFSGAPGEFAPSAAAKPQGGRAEASIPQPSGPMIVRTASVTIVTKEFDATRAAMERLVRQHGGYLANLNVSGQSGTGRALTATLRAPADRLDSLLAELKRLGRVEAESQAGEEITQQYVDLAARLKNARVTEQRLAQILAQRTGKVADVLEVEREIARVRGEIERMDAQRKTMENQVSFATVKFELREEYQAQLEVAPPSTWSRLRNAAVEGYHSVVETAIGLAVFLLSDGPTIVLWGLLLFWPARLLWRRFRRAAA